MAEPRPNLLIFMTDQQQGATVLPQHPCRMPNVERLAAEGLTFSEAYCPAPHCCPSRATFMSGLYPSRHGIDNNVATDTALGTNLRDGVRLFSEGLAASGYHLGYSGKWHVARDIMPVDRGWTDYGSGPARGQFSTSRQPANWQRAHAELAAPGPRQPGWVQRPGWGNIRVYGSQPDRGPQGYEGTGDHQIVTRAIDGLRQLAAGEGPWCLYVGPGGPHDPYVIPETFARLYDPADVDLPPSFGDDLADKPRIYQRMRYQYWGQLTEDEVRASIAHYWGYCTMMDALFGLVLAELERTGQADRTVVLFCSDHGDYLGAHGLYCKGVPAFREAYHVPAVVRWPRGLVRPGRSTDGLVSLADFAPTFLELAGAPGAEQCDGRSLLPFVRDEQPAAWRDAVFTQLNGVELYYTQRSILTKDWRYVYNGFDFDELYDRRADPHELVNLAFPDIRALPAPHHNRTAAPWPPLTPDLEAVRTDLLQRLWRFAHQHDDHIFNPYWTVGLAPLGPGSVLGG